MNSILDKTKCEESWESASIDVIGGAEISKCKKYFTTYFKKRISLDEPKINIKKDSDLEEEYLMFEGAKGCVF
ncbi:hypothetical protein CWI38_0436p0010 [Hamiltosporidium tvaerminnensis]|uniref:Uncharacterized protein n=1 Tax=Hamiltosporidium tvaerminnensis TaxID=1176355 RepID=A0A4Q9LYP4_9MICR|nr:hypothetical protein CWI38_0436p0010 [Hamiltosporidium tvaerminnensis]